MKIAICGSMVFANDMKIVAKKLESDGHKVFTPSFLDQYVTKDHDTIHKESVQNKANYDLIRGYYKIIKRCDAILVLNYEKNLTPGYIGGNTFLEMGFAHVLNKTILVLYEPSPSSPFKDEIEAMNPIICNGILPQSV